MKVSKGNCAFVGGCAVRDIRIRESHRCDKGATEAVADISKQKPVNGKGFRHSGCEDSNDLGNKQTAGDERDHAGSTVAVRERAKLGAGDGGEEAGDDVAVEGECRDPRLDCGYLTLRVVGAKHDWHRGEVWIFELLLLEVLAADEGEDKVDFGDDDATKGKCGH